MSKYDADSSLPGLETLIPPTFCATCQSRSEGYHPPFAQGERYQVGNLKYANNLVRCTLAPYVSSDMADGFSRQRFTVKWRYGFGLRVSLLAKSPMSHNSHVTQRHGYHSTSTPLIGALQTDIPAVLAQTGETVNTGRNTPPNSGSEAPYNHAQGLRGTQPGSGTGQVGFAVPLVRSVNPFVIFHVPILLPRHRAVLQITLDSGL